VPAGVAFYAKLARHPVSAGTEGGAVAVDPAVIAAVRTVPHVLFRITAPDRTHGRVGIVPLDRPNAPPVVTGLSCDRVYATLDHGLCLQASRGVFTRYRAIAFDRTLTEQHAFSLPGAPSRTRVAPTASLAASTVFVSGDSYASGGFSTRTAIYDLRSGTTLGDLESFAVSRDGQLFKRQDFNFWGVTFRSDGERFYATLGTSGALYLVEGSVSARSLKVIGTDVECPSLSPDGTRLVYKARHREGTRVFWRLNVLDLTRGTRSELPETRTVDDQPEWLDSEHVLYALPREGTGSSDVWVIGADGSGTPHILVANAFSPAVVRP
jgi:hypothetical protein